MGIEELTNFEILQGILTIIYVLIAIIIGVKISLKYYTYNKIELITVGIGMVFISSPWWPSSISFVTYILFDQILEPRLYFFLNYGLIIVALMCWIYSFCLLVYPKSIKKIVVPFLVICITWEIFLITSLIIDSSLISSKIGKFDSQTTPITSLFALFSIISTFITIVLFTRICIKSESKKNQWRGKLILLNMIIFTIAAIIDISSGTGDPMILVLTRFLLMSRSIIAYLGWIMPERFTNWLIKDIKKEEILKW